MNIEKNDSLVELKTKSNEGISKNKFAKTLAKKLINEGLKSSFENKLFYNLLNKMMMIKVDRESYKKTASVVDKDLICRQNNLKISRSNFFRDKENVTEVEDCCGKKYVLKTGRIESFQVKLLKKAKELEGDLCFKVPDIEKEGEDWLLLEKIDGCLLNEYYKNDSDGCAKISNDIAYDYQKLILAVNQNNELGDVLLDGEQWLYSRLNIWSKPIVEADMIDISLVKRLKDDFAKNIKKKGANFFGWAHGNITGDHVMKTSTGDAYLFDLDVVARVGKGYYDFLRALDFMFFKAENEQEIYEKIPRWMEKYLGDFSQEEVRLIFAFRNIGILGWDFLHNKSVEQEKNINNYKKINMLLNFIDRTY